MTSNLDDLTSGVYYSVQADEFICIELNEEGKVIEKNAITGQEIFKTTKQEYRAYLTNKNKTMLKPIPNGVIRNPEKVVEAAMDNLFRDFHGSFSDWSEYVVHFAWKIVRVESIDDVYCK